MADHVKINFGKKRMDQTLLKTLLRTTPDRVMQHQEKLIKLSYESGVLTSHQQ